MSWRLSRRKRCEWGESGMAMRIELTCSCPSTIRSKARFQAQAALTKTIPAKRANGMDASIPRRPMGSELLLHFRLSSQIVQALLTSLQASYSSSALPPPPIPRPGKRQGRRQNSAKGDEDDAWDVPASLDSLPIWASSGSSSASPTPATLLPSLVLVHASLDEALLRARTHRSNTHRIALLQEEVAELRKARRARVRSLRDAAAELRDLVVRGEGDVAIPLGASGQGSKAKGSKRRPLPVSRADVLAYAAELARTTSAPPGWGGAAAILAKQKAEAAGQDGEQDGQADGEVEAKGEVEGEDTIMQESKDGQEEQQPAAEAAAKAVEPGTPATAATAPKDKPAAQQPGASSSLLLLALEEQQRREQAANGGANGEQAALIDPATSASSAPHTLPFPSDADMRRGLMGVAMLADAAQEAEENRLEDQQPAMQGLLPSWREFGRLKKLEEQEQQANAPPSTTTTAAQPTVRPEGARRPVEAAHDQDASGFGLDL